MQSDSLVILLAEDDDGHAALVERNLRRSGISNELVRIADGQAALDCLHRRGDFADRVPRGPVLLLLDVNTPRVDGVEVLRRVKADPATAKLPVIMLTTTDDPREVERCYGLGCRVYVTKPVEYDRFVVAVQRLGLFLQIIELPRKCDGRS